MLSGQLGFVSSWKMLTRDKGWIKPLLIIALVSWIPILGPIVVLGYGLEWARLTAWGVDSAPKQRGIGYKKMLITGCTAYLISIFMGLVIVALGVFGFGGVYSVAVLNSGTTNIFSDGSLETLVGGLVSGWISPWMFVIIIVVNLLLETFILAAEMRSTLYDGFSAGWRVDRLLQMVVRDVGGFIHVCGISLLGSVICTACDALVTFAGRVTLLRGIIGLSITLNSMSSLMGAIVRLGIMPAIIILVLGVVLLFAIQVLEVALQLVTINAMGQWFQRFEVGRWGTSSDPLPEGVPHSAEKGKKPSAPAEVAAEPMSDEAAQGEAPEEARPEDAAPSAAEAQAGSPQDQPVTQLEQDGGPAISLDVLDDDDEGPWSHPERDFDPMNPMGSDDGSGEDHDPTGNEGGSEEDRVQDSL